ncbi:uncharacterized protein A1O9_09346 [Exophiala aquamarina CBS 119918]|uniref:Uncharacterized protein n=1 Tax=Exophiala aquamarina CBS 119918 TaxID=1182545 RepID=A0A072P6J6_9EURO|nr:uncharacterized protein A1O9_09346 [Exophiala aquamarina CBS 119918]KEF54903.1 hypothetical protein A1O9_09346 [Exophiala aquamarina CBS 119918]
MHAQRVLRSLIYTYLVQELLAQAFQPCAILGPRFPRPSAFAQDNSVQAAINDTTAAFDELIATGNSTFGTISNTTSFSIALFTSNDPLNLSHPFFFEYHYTAPALKENGLGTSNLDSNSIFRISTVSQVFTVWMFLIEAGEAYWVDPITKYVPELSNDKGRGSVTSGLFSWGDVSLGDLAGHLSGIPRDSTAPLANSRIAQDRVSQSPLLMDSLRWANSDLPEFFQDLTARYPVYLPGTTPIMSNTAFQLLSYALESIKQTTYEAIFNATAQAIGLRGSTLRQPPTTENVVVPGDNITQSGWSIDFGDEAAAISMYSTISDLSRAGVAMLNSTLVPSATTRRWLKPIVNTSNLRNDVGRPWIVYKATANQSPINPVIDILTSYGSVGRYSSYFGLVPDYNVGFTILAVDEIAAPDLNVHADIVGGFIAGLEKAAISQAAVRYAGVYSSNETNASLVMDKPDGIPGLSLTNFTVGDMNIRREIAVALNIAPAALSIRLYPSNVAEDTETGVFIFRAVFQDTDAPIDAGTPTCITWLTVDALNLNGKPLDLFIFTLEKGKVTGVQIPALDLQIAKAT